MVGDIQYILPLFAFRPAAMKENITKGAVAVMNAEPFCRIFS
jgi:hypothetical protein